MKKLVLLFLLFFSASAFSLEILGLNYTTDSGVFVDSNATHFVVNIKEDSIVYATEVIRRDPSSEKQIHIVLHEGSTLFNPDGADLKIDSNIVVLMQGIYAKPAKIDSQGKNLIIDSNLFIQGNSVISSSGLNGANGSWHGPDDEGDCGKCGNYNFKCSIDNDSSHRYAKPGGNAGNLLMKNVFVFDDVNFSANGGDGGVGAYGCNEDQGSPCEGDGQEAIRGGNGGNGGNAALIEVENLFAVTGLVNFNASGGGGGHGGEGGDNGSCGGAHDGGDGGNGGNSTGKILINNLTNDSAEIRVFLNRGVAGTRGAKGTDDGGMCGCNGADGRHGSAGSSTADFSLPVLTGFAPKLVSARNIEIKAKVLEDLVFFAGTKYTALSDINVSGCRIKGNGTELTDESEEQISMTARTLDVNVWNPAWFFDRVKLSGKLFYSKNNACVLNQRQLMAIPFNGRIRTVSTGIIKDIKITNSVSNQIEFIDLDELGVPKKRLFSDGVFSAELNAELYPNFFYKIQFTVCNSSESSCENFAFDFFTWKRLW
ncbi:MAG: hypothetical protein ABH986_06640 [archaeon]